MRDYGDFIQDIRESIANIESFVNGMSFNDFKSNKETHFAVVRCIEIIGEAIKKIPEEIRSKHPNVPWKKAAGMRDKMIHAYWDVDLKIVWDVVQKDITQLKIDIEKIQL